MAFKDNSDLLKDALVMILPLDEKFIDLSVQQEAVLEVLQKINPIAADAYKAGLYFLKKEDFPMRNFFICHSFYLLSEIFMKADEQAQFSEFKTHMTNNLKRAIKINDWFEDDICDELIGRDSTQKQIKKMWEELGNISKGKSYKWHYFIKSFRPKIKDNIMQDMILKIKEAMEHFHSGRHYNASKYNPNQNYEKSVETVEKFILELEQPYLEAKEVLDGILAETNRRTD